ncbi:MAG: hypothetical protein GX864_00785, partial [Mollicutes bacterium]|nr:hypothetical protein [Mollicutes bacterium]
MKRIANILTVFIAIFIFIFFYQNISSKHYNSVVGLESSFAETTKKDYAVINYSLYDEKDNEVFYKLINFLEEFNYDAVASVQNKRFDFIIDSTTYIYSNKILNSFNFFKSKNKKDIDFTLNDNSYYSSFIKDEKATDIIDFINRSYHKEYQPKLIIKQFRSYLTDNPKKRNATIYLYSDDYGNLIRDIENNEISKHIISDDFTYYELPEAETLNIDTIKILLILSISSLIVISICDLIQEKKEITIRKLFGEKNSSIFLNLIAKRYLVNLILYIITQVLLYIIIIKAVRPIHLLFLKPLLIIFGMYFIIWTLANLMSYFILKQVGRAINLKQTSALGLINPISLLIKIVLIVLMIIPFITLFTSASLTIEENFILRKNKENMINNLAINSIDTGSGDYDLEEYLDITVNFLKDLNVVYHDFSSNYLAKEHMEEIPEGMVPELPYIVANCNYLNNYNIKNLKGNVIDLKLLKNNTLLVPELYKDSQFGEVYCHGPCENIIYIQNGINFYSNYPLVHDIEFLRQHNPVILFKDQIEIDNNIRWSEGFLFIPDSKDTQKKINNFLVNNKLNNIVFISNLNNVYTTA